MQHKIVSLYGSLTSFRVSVLELIFMFMKTRAMQNSLFFRFSAKHRDVQLVEGSLFGWLNCPELSGEFLRLF